MTTSQAPPSGENANNDIPDFRLSSLEGFFESSARISLAGIGGAAVGLAQQQQSAKGTGVPLSSRSMHAHRRPLPMGNPHLPTSWAISCMLFALVLESSRKASPTNVLLENLGVSDRQNVTKIAATAVGDYTFGGIVAGLAGGLAARRRAPSRTGYAPKKGMLMWGVCVGMGLGFLAGLVQAGVDVGSLYLEQEQTRQRSEMTGSSSANLQPRSSR